MSSVVFRFEQWGFLSVPHLQWHGAFVYNGNLRGPVTFTPISERLAVELSLPVFTTWVCRGWDSNTQPSTCGADALTHRRCSNYTICLSHVISMTMPMVCQLLDIWSQIWKAYWDKLDVYQYLCGNIFCKIQSQR